MDQFIRSRLLIGSEGMKRLSRARVAVFGLGGVGGAAAEALVRSGIGAIDLFDNDRVAPSNLNRQIIAVHSTIGMEKTEAMRARLLDINPALLVEARSLFYLPETADQVDLARYDYVVDAIDTVKAKLELACRASALAVPIISAMGAGNKLDPTKLKVADIYETSVCPLARVMRSELRRRGVPSLKVVYSTEEALTPRTEEVDMDSAEVTPAGSSRRSTPGSMAFVPPVMGMIIAGEVVRGLAFAGRAARGSGA